MKNHITFIFIKMMSHDLLVPAQFQVPQVMENEFSAVFFQLGICCNLMQGKSVSCTITVMRICRFSLFHV